MMGRRDYLTAREHILLDLVRSKLSSLHGWHDAGGIRPTVRIFSTDPTFLDLFPLSRLRPIHTCCTGRGYWLLATKIHDNMGVTMAAAVTTATNPGLHGDRAYGEEQTVSVLRFSRKDLSLATSAHSFATNIDQVI